MAPYDPPATNFPDEVTLETGVALEEPLLGKHESVEENVEAKEECVHSSKTYSLIIGVIIGCFIQFSSMGANFLMTSMYGGYDVFFTQKFAIISTIWCFLTSVMAVCVLMFVRSLVVTSFYATNEVVDTDTFKSKERFVAKLIQEMEYHFSIGSIFGVCFCWTVTDGLLGMKNSIEHGLITLAIALLWCRLALKYCEQSADEDDTNQPQHNTSPDRITMSVAKANKSMQSMNEFIVT